MREETAREGRNRRQRLPLVFGDEIVAERLLGDVIRQLGHHVVEEPGHATAAKVVEVLDVESLDPNGPIHEERSVPPSLGRERESWIGHSLSLLALPP